MEVLLYFGLPIKNEHDDFSCPQKFIAYPQPHEILKCRFLFEVDIIKTQHYEGFDFDLNGVLDDINHYLRKTIACMSERCQMTVFIEYFFILCIN